MKGSWKRAALTAAVLAVGMGIIGCRGQTYERIEAETDTQTEAVVVIAESDAGTEEIMIETEETAPEEKEARPLRLLFGGDVLLSDHVLNAYSQAGGIHGVLDEDFRNVIDSADFFMVNEEFPFSDRGVKAADKQYTFRLEPEKVSVFQEMGIDAVTLANNHALDFGVDALLDTCTVLDGARILHAGAGADLAEAKKPVETEISGQRIAVIGATRVVPDYRWTALDDRPGMLSAYESVSEALLEEIRVQKQAGKLTAVYVHWGIERDEKPQEYQRAMAKQYIDAGADIVIGSHPHVLQGIEYYRGKPIVYSLGNFVFGSSIPRTMLLEVTVEPDEAYADVPLLSLRVLPGTSAAGRTRMLSDEEERREFYRYLEGISFGVTIASDGTVTP